MAGPHALLLAAIFLLAPAAPKRAPEVVEEPDGDLLHLFVKGDPAAQGWLHRPTGTEEPDPAEPVDLVVALHGAGGSPKNFLFNRLMADRSAWCLAVAGRTAVTHERGQGFQWDAAGAEYVADLTRHLVARYPIRRERVIVCGHSAGGTMALETIAKAPDLFAGALSTAAPRTPDSRHTNCRTAVFLGMKDPNWAGAPTVRSFAEKLARKRAKGACAFFAVEGLGHDMPADDYLALGFDWILEEGARGGEATVPLEPVGREGSLRHILVRHKGAEGATGVRRSKGAANKLLSSLRRDLEKHRAFFPFEAACLSEDTASASCGGSIEEEDLAAFGVTLPDLAPGEVSVVLEGRQGLHLVVRPADR